MQRPTTIAVPRPMRTTIILALALALAASTIVTQALRPASTRAGAPACTLFAADAGSQPTVDQTMVVPNEFYQFTGSGWNANAVLQFDSFDVSRNVTEHETINTTASGTINTPGVFFEGSEGTWIFTARQTSPACEAEASVHVLPLNDIVNSQFLDDIKWLYSEGITSGCSGEAFCPNGLVTRGQMATFLVRSLGLPATSTDFFTDDNNSVHEANINRLRAAGITAGCGGSRFCPNGLVTRAQMATFLARAFGLPAAPADSFTDDDGSVHEPNIDRVAAAGITHGCGGTRYCPSGIVTRGQMAAFLHRAAD